MICEVLLKSKVTEWQSFNVHSNWRAIYTRNQWGNLTRTANGYSARFSKKRPEIQPLPPGLITAARAAWPRVVAHADRELHQEDSTRESEALAADIWEAVLRSVCKALQRKGEYASSIGDLES